MKKKLTIFYLIFVVSVSAQTKIISWNIQDFGKTKTTETIEKIANITRDYDIIVLQEVVAGYGGTQAVAKLADELNRKGSKWDYITSPKTKSPKYKTERYAFLWKTSKVKAIGRGRLLSELEQEIYREPFLMDFEVNHNVFTILNYHSRKHDDNPSEEIKYLVDYLLAQDKAVILAGDFNTKQNAKVFQPLYKNGFVSILKNIKTTLKRKCKLGNYLSHPIDNMFLSQEKFTILKFGVIDFVKKCELLLQSRKISDHLPVTLTITLI